MLEEMIFRWFVVQQLELELCSNICPHLQAHSHSHLSLNILISVSQLNQTLSLPSLMRAMSKYSSTWLNLTNGKSLRRGKVTFSIRWSVWEMTLLTILFYAYIWFCWNMCKYLIFLYLRLEKRRHEWNFKLNYFFFCGTLIYICQSVIPLHLRQSHHIL